MAAAAAAAAGVGVVVAVPKGPCTQIVNILWP